MSSQKSERYSRVPLPALQTMNAAQRASYDQSVAAFGAPTGPRLVMIDTPEVAAAWTGLAGALAKSALPKSLWELTILTVAREWDSQFEWWAHEPAALKAGVSPEVIAAIKTGETPRFGNDAQAATYSYVTELYRHHRVADATYDRLRAIIGSRQLVELTVLMGHYNNVAIALAAHDVQLPPGVAAPLPPK